MTRVGWRGLYAIIDLGQSAPTDLAARVEAAISGGAILIQYRDKNTSMSTRRDRAETILSVCRDRQVPLIINDDIALAVEVGANGVHLGRNDAPISVARQQLGNHAIIGVSCYNDLSRAIATAKRGANYVAFGRFFPSHTKSHAGQAELDILSRAKQCLNVPVVAIGGITSDNGAALIAAGADMLAVIHGVFGQSDVTAAARSIANLFANSTDGRLNKTISASLSGVIA